MWGLCAGHWVYEGCGLLLKDGQPCALGKYKRKLRAQNSESPLGRYSQSHNDHVCAAVGDGTFMFCFAMQVGELVIQVNEDCGMQLMGMSGQSFKEFYDADYASLSNLCAEVKSVFWRISYVRNESGEELPRALSFEQCPCKVEDKTGVLQHVMKEEQASDPEKMLADTPKDRRGLIREEAESANGGDRRGLTASFGRFRGALTDLSGEIVHSLKGFRISE
ncbi:unnamed protein product [Calypogeia fissa]